MQECEHGIGRRLLVLALTERLGYSRPNFFRAGFRIDPEAPGEVLMRGGLVVALLLLAAASAQAQAHEAARYTFGGAADQGTFVLDTQTGRVWRYDRVDDAWYLYDLEALVRTPRGEAGRTLRDEGDKPAPEKGRAE